MGALAVRLVADRRRVGPPSGKVDSAGSFTHHPRAQRHLEFGWQAAHLAGPHAAAPVWR